ncbi:MAG: hypothetical protein LBM93_02430 [Oscillospiraceae bacterium]|jgi:hypothetical protein|nr:hypothetical protein [Oscillospiraceae bacterium]
MGTKAIIENFMTAYETQNSEYIFSLNSDFDGKLSKDNKNKYAKIEENKECFIEIDFQSLYKKISPVYFLEKMSRLSDPPLSYAVYQGYDSDNERYISNRHIPLSVYPIARIIPVSEDEIDRMKEKIRPIYLQELQCSFDIYSDKPEEESSYSDEENLYDYMVYTGCDVIMTCQTIIDDASTTDNVRELLKRVIKIAEEKHDN